MGECTVLSSFCHQSNKRRGLLNVAGVSSIPTLAMIGDELKPHSIIGSIIIFLLTIPPSVQRSTSHALISLTLIFLSHKSSPTKPYYWHGLYLLQFERASTCFNCFSWVKDKQGSCLCICNLHQNQSHKTREVQSHQIGLSEARRVMTNPPFALHTFYSAARETPWFWRCGVHCQLNLSLNTQYILCVDFHHPSHLTPRWQYWTFVTVLRMSANRPRMNPYSCFMSSTICCPMSSFKTYFKLKWRWRDRLLIFVVSNFIASLVSLLFARPQGTWNPTASWITLWICRIHRRHRNPIYRIYLVKRIHGIHC